MEYDAASGAKTYLAADERGSVIARSNASGVVTAVNTYDEYGIPGSGNTGRFGYTGQAWIPELGMAYYKARMYSPTLGRFMQTDPIGYGDGMNWYNYTGSDPVNGSDPSGTDNPKCEYCKQKEEDPPAGPDIIVTGSRWRPEPQPDARLPFGLELLNPYANPQPAQGNDEGRAGDIIVTATRHQSTRKAPATAPGVSRMSKDCQNVYNQPGGVIVVLGGGAFVPGWGGTASLGTFYNISTGSGGFFYSLGTGWGLQAGLGMQGGYYSSAQSLYGTNQNINVQAVASGTLSLSKDGTFAGITAGGGARAGGSYTVSGTDFFGCLFMASPQ